MTTNFSGSAKIYTFPPRGRFAANGGDAKPAVRVQLPPGAKLAVGGAWYHDEAIAQTHAVEPGRNN